MRSWLVVVALAACSHPEPATTPKPIAASPCKRTADQIVDLLAMQAQARGQQIGPDLYKQMSDSLVERCDKDKWSAEAQQCATAAKTPEDFGSCEDKFTPAQRDALIQSVGGDTRKAEEAAPAAPAPGAQPAAAPPPPPTTTRGGKPASKASDPCEGGQ